MRYFTPQVHVVLFGLKDHIQNNNQFSLNYSFNYLFARYGKFKMKTCWSCKGMTEDKSIFCTTCKIVQPLVGLSHFELLGIKNTFVVDADMLEMVYLKKQMVLHPDKFMSKTIKEQLHALTWGASLNDAYATLTNDVSRAVYMLELLGHVDVLNTHRTLSQSLMAYQFEIREREMDGEDKTTLIEEVGTACSVCYKEVAEALATEQIEPAISKTVELRFLSKFLSDLKAH
jgi:molecular chaperone HscB